MYRMSLDVWLKDKAPCQHCGGETGRGETVFDANITHNLGEMAEAAGMYEALWRPYRLKQGFDEIEELHNYDEECKFEGKQVVLAGEIVPILQKGLADMKARPKHYKKFDSPNGWGLYENFVPWIEEYLKACEDYPEATIHISR